MKKAKVYLKLRNLQAAIKRLPEVPLVHPHPWVEVTNTQCNTWCMLGICPHVKPMYSRTRSGVQFICSYRISPQAAALLHANEQMLKPLIPFI